MMMKMAVAAATAFVCVSADCADESRAQRVGARCWEDVRVLSDDALEGRRAGSPGHRRAAEFVVDNFRKAGLKPGANGGYLQEVRLESRQIVEAHSSLMLASASQERPLKLGDDAGFLLRGDITPSVTAPLVFVGHGLVLAAIGWFLSRRSSLGGLLVACGLSGMIFGFLYGSIFGFEEILPHHPFFGQFFWLSPIHDVLSILRLAIGAGIVLLILAHLLNLYNAARAKDWGRFFFDSNGLAGLVLYLSFLVLLGNVASILFTGDSFIPGILTTIGKIGVVVTLAKILFVVGLFLATIFSHPLQHWMETGHFEVEGGWGMFAVQSAAEVLEKFISMLSNTLSYVRVGAFAIVHAGFTGAVFVIARLLSGGEDGGLAYWLVVIFGNLFVIGLEGFIVTIQTMRLHYYEFFSKFFRGGGSSYEPLALGGVQEK